MIAVIYYAYGAPKSISGVEDYFSHIMKGKKVPEAMLNSLIEAFKAPGFPDFICSSTERIAKGIEKLVAREIDEEVRVYVAYKHTAPFVEDVYKEVVAAGATKIVTLSVNPILSASGGGAVHTEIAALNEGNSMEHIAIDDYHLDEGIVTIYADRVTRAFNWLSKEAQQQSYVLFTVHSQPVDPERNELYVQQFEQLAAAIANKAGIINYACTYRSGHASGWLSPDVKNKMKQLAGEGAKGFVTCELLSVVADVESFSEINADCQQVAKELGVDFAVSEFLGDSFDLVEAKANLILNRL